MFLSTHERHLLAEQFDMIPPITWEIPSPNNVFTSVNKPRLLTLWENKFKSCHLLKIRYFVILNDEIKSGRMSLHFNDDIQISAFEALWRLKICTLAMKVKDTLCTVWHIWKCMAFIILLLQVSCMSYLLMRGFYHYIQFHRRGPGAVSKRFLTSGQ